MKFKENAIKKGMVIHCSTEDEAKALLKYLKELEYVWCNDNEIDSNDTHYEAYEENTCYDIGYCGNKKIAFCELSCESERGSSITEFSDLLEPVKTSTDLPENKQLEMTAVEIVEWLSHFATYDDYRDAFGGLHDEYGDEYGFADLVNEYTPQEIVREITAYEAKKKAPKPVETEWVDVCRIIKVKADGTKKCVYEEDIPNEMCLGVLDACADILKKYISEHDGEYITTVESVCRVKKGGRS